MPPVRKRQRKRKEMGEGRVNFHARIMRELGLSGEKVKVKGEFDVPHDIEEQNNLIRACIEWASTDDAMEIDDFPVKFYISPARFYKLAETNEYFKNGLAIANALIAGRLKQDVRRRNLDKDYLFRLLPLYSPRYKELIQEKWKSDKDTKPIQILMPKFYKEDKDE